MSIYALKTNTKVNHDLLAQGDLQIHDHRLSNFAGTLPEFLVYLNGFVKENPTRVATELFNYSYEGVEVLPVETEHKELIDEVSAMIRLLPMVANLIYYVTPEHPVPLGTFKDNKELREHDHQLKWLKRITVDLIVREQTRPQDTANIQLADALVNLRGRLTECQQNAFVQKAIAENWINPSFADLDDCCSEFGAYVDHDFDNNGQLVQVTPSSIYVDLAALYLTHEQKMAIIKEAVDLGVPTTWHPLGVQIHYLPVVEGPEGPDYNTYAVNV